MLNAEYKKVENFTNDLIDNSQSLAIMSDGWSNIRHESIVNFIVTTPKPVFVESVETKEERHTGNLIALNSRHNN